MFSFLPLLTLNYVVNLCNHSFVLLFYCLENLQPWVNALMLQMSWAPERWWRNSLNQTDQVQFKFLPTNSRGPSMECTNNTWCPLFIHSLIFLANYFTSSVLASNYTTSCLSSYLAEWKNKIRKELAQTTPTIFTYVPPSVSINSAFPGKLSNSYKRSVPPLVNHMHAAPPRWYFSSNSSLFFLHLFCLSTWVFLPAYRLAISPIFIFFSHPKNYNICSHVIHWLQSYFSCPFKQNSWKFLSTLSVPKFPLSFSLIALQSGHCPIHSTKIYLWPPT